MVQTDCVKILVISGATATGKSGLAIKLAQKINGEIISADSMQIYKGMDIGTAKISKAERAQVPHHLIDIKKPDERYSVKEYKDDAEKAITDVLKRGKTPIIAGGTGLYINSLIYDYSFTGDGTDVKRQIKPNFKLIVLQRERQELYEKINVRVEEMLKEGLLDEIKNLIANGADFNMQSMQAIGYKEFKDFFEEKLSLEACTELLKQHTRNYAKRQITWFKQWVSSPNVHYLNFNTDIDEVLKIWKAN